MLQRLKRRLPMRDDRGVTAVEVGLIIGGVAIVVIPGIVWLQSSLGGSYTTTVANDPGVCATTGCDAITNDVPAAPFANTVAFGPPGAPQSFVATPGDATAVLTWSAPVSDGGAAITGYSVSGAPAGSCSTTPPTTTCTLTGLGNGALHTFSLTATNANGTGPAVTATATPNAAAAPSAPTSFVALGSNGQVSLTWGPPSALNGSTLTGYTLTITGSGAPGPQSFGAGAGSATITGLSNGVTYTFDLVANSSAGDSPGASSTATPSTVPGAPTAVVGTAGNGQVSVAWSAPSSTGGSAILDYTVTSSPGGVSCTSANSPCVVTPLTNGTPYTFTVTARNGNGSGPASSPSAAVTPATVPGAPTGVSGTPGNGQVTVAWTAPGVTGGSAIIDYTVTATPGGSTCTSTAPTVTCIVTGLTNGTGYVFSVVARNAAGSGSSGSSGTVTPRTTPGPPTNLQAVTGGNKKVDLSWDPPVDNGGSAITQYDYRWTTATSTACNSTWTVVNNKNSPVSDGVSTSGAYYCYEVRARNAVGNGAWSATAGPVQSG